jgi:hypothetical protein
VVLLLALVAFALCTQARATTYEVGPDKALAAIADVPWEALKPGDTVLINYRAEAYHEKFCVGVAGTAEAPITVRGVPGANGELPVLDGRDATTRKGLTFSNQRRSIIQFGGLADAPDGAVNVIVENLELRSCRAPYTFTNSKGEKEAYEEGSGPVRFNVCNGVILRNCVMTDGGMGTISSGGLTRDITIEGCYYVDNGLETPRGAYVHQSYTETLGMLYQYNHFSHLRKDCTGTNLKDRSAGNVIRYNWIEGGNKQIDLPDWYDTQHRRTEMLAAGARVDYVQWLKDDDAYRSTFIYGNILIEPEGDGNPEMITYGGDMGEPEYYHKGILYFYNNTIVSKRTDTTTIFKLKTKDESCDARNNVFYTAAPGATLAISMYEGTVYMSHNWIKPGWVSSHSKDEFRGEVIDDGTTVTGDNPGFVDEAAQDYHLAKGSPCIDAGRKLNPRTLPENDVNRQYLSDRKGEPRPSDGTLDIGAFEYSGEKK